MVVLIINNVGTSNVKVHFAELEHIKKYKKITNISKKITIYKYLTTVICLVFTLTIYDM